MLLHILQQQFWAIKKCCLTVVIKFYSECVNVDLNMSGVSHSYYYLWHIKETGHEKYSQVNTVNHQSVGSLSVAPLSVVSSVVSTFSVSCLFTSGDLLEQASAHTTASVDKSFPCLSSIVQHFLFL